MKKVIIFIFFTVVIAAMDELYLEYCLSREFPFLGAVLIAVGLVVLNIYYFVYIIRTLTWTLKIKYPKNESTINECPDK